MTASPSLSSYTADERAVLFFRHVKKELAMPSTRDTVRLVGKVLSNLLRGMPVQRTTAFLNYLPGMIQMLLLENRAEATADQYSCDHLDEFVDRIFEEDQLASHSFFATEVEALNRVIVILRRMDTYLDLFTYKILNDSWVDELRQIPLEDAA